jgi:hypothetical protein
MPRRVGGSRPCSRERLLEALAKLKAYCREQNWAGIDPYDALNSPLFEHTPLGRSRFARLAATQLLKRSPVNLRPLLGIGPHQNPKALALFLMAYVRMARSGDQASRARAQCLAERILELRSPGTDYWCWGYSFPWQTRRQLVPRFGPNLVCTTFVAEGLLDAYELGLGARYLEAAASAGQFMVQKLFWRDGDRAGFAYPLPHLQGPIHNASFLAAALLCRLARLTGDRSSLEPALAAARYSAGSQRPDGSWAYGVAPSQQWVDSFHTGFNLCALQSVARHAGSGEFDDVLAKGFAFYRSRFFTADGVANYFHDRTYPIDIHSVAQGVLTLIALQHLDPHAEPLALTVLAWTMSHMWDERGFFYYRVLRGMRNRTAFMRWSQAWMMLALVAATDSSDAAATDEGAAVAVPPREVVQ